MESTLFSLSDDSPQVGAGIGLSGPLPSRMRPKNFDEYSGQEHILGKGRLLKRAIDSDSFTSIVLFGPPGTGKTSLAELIATVTHSAFIRISAVSSNVAEIRKEVKEAELRLSASGRRTILFIDEIHRFNRAQQDILLPFIENGTVRFVGATTQNPYFYVIGPLLSRSLVFRLESLSKDNILQIMRRAISDERGFPGKLVHIQNDAIEFLAQVCEGDARRALNALEIAVLTTEPDSDGKICVDIQTAQDSIQKKVLNYGDDGHYDTASAFIKSMRGSDPDASLYWLGKMLDAGEDISFIARRIVIFSSEDVGNADPRALTIALNAMQAIEMIGMPEARIILAQAVTYCSTAPKSNASYLGIDQVLDDIKNDRVQPVPTHLRDSHYKGAEKLGHGKDYVYPHSEKNSFAVQEYMGVPKKYYNPAGIGYESKIKERIEFWENLKTGKKQ